MARWDEFSPIRVVELRMRVREIRFKLKGVLGQIERIDLSLTKGRLQDEIDALLRAKSKALKALRQEAKRKPHKK